MRVTLISGLSGSGKSIALKLLEDLGFFCVDNLPLELLPKLIELYQHDGEETMLAISMDVRSRRSAEEIAAIVNSIRQNVDRVDMLFLEAREDVLLKRFSETRRSHPLAGCDMTLAEALSSERESMQALRDLAYCIDTSQMTAQSLRYFVQQWIDLGQASLYVVFESFGFKYGLPTDADFVFDVRSLPNPFYDPALRPYSGLDQPIQDFFARHEQVAAMLADIEQFLRKWLPAIEQENRSYVTIGIGCTGGQHRSVFMVEALAKRFAAYHTLVRHRQLAHIQVPTLPGHN